MTKKDDEIVVGTLADKADESFIQSGVKELDELIGGIPRGRITEFWGKEGCGKSHLASLIMANISKTHKVLFVDSEFSLNKSRVESLGALPENIDYYASSHLEEVCQLIIDSVGKYDLIILDSLAFLTPNTVANSEMGERAIGLFSLLIKQWVLKFRPKLGTSKTAFIAINQYRPSIGLYVVEESPGGKAWHHATDVRIRLSTASVDKIMDKKVQLGHWVHLIVKKSKVSQPFIESKTKIMY